MIVLIKDGKPWLTDEGHTQYAASVKDVPVGCSYLEMDPEVIHPRCVRDTLENGVIVECPTKKAEQGL